MAVDSKLIVVGQAGSPCLDSWRGLDCAALERRLRIACMSGAVR